jgi:hypothetical protein
VSFSIEEITVVPGYAQALIFRPKLDCKDPLFTRSFTVVNVYVPVLSDGKSKFLREFVFEKLTAFKADSEFLIVAGDWNMTESATDTSNPRDHYSSSKEIRKHFSTFLRKHSLSEVYQPIHTRTKGSSTARLDRIYVSHTIPQKCVMNPTVIIAEHPHCPGLGEGRGPSDHWPVQLSFSPPNLAPGSRFKIPTWIAKLPLLHERIIKEYQSRPHSAHPIRDWLLLKRIVAEEAKTLMREYRAHATTKAASLSISISLFRKLKAGLISASKARSTAAADPILLQAVNADLNLGDGVFPKLQVHINSIFKSCPRINPTSVCKPNFLRDAKHTLPQEKKHLTFLYDGGDRIECPSAVANLLKEAWEPVWNKDNTSASRVSQYLQNYGKTVQQSLLRTITPELVKEVMLRHRDSSTGSNGIPFELWRGIAEVAAGLRGH